MRTISTDQEQALQSADQAVFQRVEIKDSGGAWIDWSDYQGHDWILAWQYRESIDQPVVAIELTMIREHELLRASPLVEDSKLNQITGSYQPIIDVGRDIKISTALVAIGEAPLSGDYELMFEGKIDELDFGGLDGTMKVRARDQGAILQDTFIEDQGTYSSGTGTAVETIMQQILNDNLASPPTLYVPTSPSWAIKQYIQQKEPILTALRNLAAQIGWDVRYRWDTGTSTFRLTLYEPDRTATVAQRTFTASDYLDISASTISRKGIRNVVRVVFTDSSDGMARKTSEQSDATSIAKYGRRFMELGEASSSMIDTNAEAIIMSQAILKDLKDPDVTHTIKVPYYWPIMLGDLYQFEQDQGLIFDQAIKLAVVGYDHKYEQGSASTTMSVRGLPSAGYRRWLHVAAGPGGPPTSDFLGVTDARQDGKTGKTGNATTTQYHISGQGTQFASSQGTNGGIVANGDFGFQSRAESGSGWPPDSWEVTTGTWGSSGDVWYSTDSVGGRRSLLLRDTATASVVVESDYLPVDNQTVYEGFMYYKSDSTDASNNIQVVVEFYNTIGGIAVTTLTLLNADPGTTGFIPSIVARDLGAKWMRVRVIKTTSTAFNFYLDSARVHKGPFSLRRYLTGAITLTKNGWYVIPYNTSSWDVGAPLQWDNTNFLFTALRPGYYDIHAQYSTEVDFTAQQNYIRIQRSIGGGAWTSYQQAVDWASDSLNLLTTRVTAFGVPLNYNDRIRFQAYSTETVAYEPGSEHCVMYIRLARPIW